MVSHKPVENRVVERGGSWLSALRRYFVVVALGNFAWEIAQLPLYTIWYDGSAREIAFAVLHCTGGDILIAGTALLAGLLIAGNSRWPHDRFLSVAATAVFAGIGYTIFSEWLNTEVRRSWAYTSHMPRLPLLGTGIAPLTQWIVIPLAAFWWAKRLSVSEARAAESGDLS
ncbi:MAG: hypothetical protein KJZ80_04825 [Hyphomicrobiaceae bacterium]|jgi:hypothetical protein|nr:hypothetical protein [Hyphomicrobiaceae bacterium]